MSYKKNYTKEKYVQKKRKKYKLSINGRHVLFIKHQLEILFLFAGS